MTLLHIDQVTTKHYLPPQPPHLPFVYLVFSVAYLCLLGFWISVCLKNRRCFHRVHLIMGGLLVTTFFHLVMCALADQHYLEVSCTPHGWDLLLYIFQFIRIVLFYCVIMLIGSGWCFWKPCLQGRDKLVFMTVTLIQVTINVILILIGETVSYSYLDRLSRIEGIVIADFLCRCAVYVSFKWSLRASRNDANASRFSRLKSCLVGVIVCFYIWSILFRRGPDYIVYQCPWVFNIVLDETVNLVVCMVLFYIFRPSEKDECIVGDDVELGLLNSIY